MSELYDMKISGSGSIPGGEYKEIKISGSGNILGDIKCEVLGISGSGDCKGKINTKEVRVSGSFSCKDNAIIHDGMRISGSASFHGNVKANEIKVSGDGKFYNDIKVNNIKVSGSSYIKGNINFDVMNVSGGIDISGDCEGSEFYSSGAGKIGGLLSADKIDINIADRWTIKEIGGEEITIRKDCSRRFLFLTLVFRNKGKLVSELIEGDAINLEYTECKIVRGHNVVIGEGCKIERVEYSGEITIDEKSTVGEKICMKN